MLTNKLFSVTAAATVAEEEKEGKRTMDDDFDIRDELAVCVLVDGICLSRTLGLDRGTCENR